MSTQSRGAALLNGAECLELLIVETRSVSVQKAVALCAEDIGHVHGGPVHPRSLRFDPGLLVCTSESWSFAKGFAAVCRCSRER